MAQRDDFSTVTGTDPDPARQLERLEGELHDGVADLERVLADPASEGLARIGEDGDLICRRCSQNRCQPRPTRSLKRSPPGCRSSICLRCSSKWTATPTSARRSPTPAGAIDALRVDGYPVTDETAAHLTAAQHDHINSYGTYSFDVESELSREGHRPLRSPPKQRELS